MADREIRIRLSGDASALVGTIKLTDEQLTKLDSTTKKLGATTSGLSKLTNTFRGGLLSLQGIIATVTAGALAHLYKSSIDNADAIAKTADSLGLSTDAYQEYRYAADRAGVDTGTFATAMQSAEKVIGNAKVGTGQLITYLKNYDPTLLSNIQHTHDMDQALQLLFQGMANAKSSTDAAALSAAVFGTTAGVKMVNLVKGGAGALDQMRQRAKDLGIVLDESLLRNAEQAKDMLTDLSYVTSAQLTQAMVDLSPELNAVVFGLTQSAHWASETLDRFRAIGAQQFIPTLGKELDDLLQQQGKLKQQLTTEESSVQQFFGILKHAGENVIGITHLTAQQQLDQVDAKIASVRARLQGLINQHFDSSAPKPYTPPTVAPPTADLTQSKSLVDGLTKSLEQQYETFGLTTSGALKYRIEAGDINQALQAMGGDTQAAKDKLLGYANALSTMTQREKEAATAEQTRNAMMTEGRQLTEQMQTPLEKYQTETQHLLDLLQGGDIDIQTFYRAWAKAQDDFQNQSSKVAIEFKQMWTSTLTTFASGIGNSVSKALFESSSLSQRLRTVIKSVEEQVVSSLIQIGVEEAVLATLRKAHLIADTAESVAAGSTIAAAWSGAAAAVSLATFGANAVPADAAMVTAYGLSKGLSLAGMAHSGLDFVPREGTYLLDKGERVLSPQDNLAFTKAVKNGAGVGAAMPPINVNMSFAISAVDTNGLEPLVRRMYPEIEKRTVKAVQRAYNARGKPGPLDQPYHPALSI